MTYTYIHSIIHIYVQVVDILDKRAKGHTFIHTCMHAYTHTHTYIHTYIQVVDILDKRAIGRAIISKK